MGAGDARAPPRVHLGPTCSLHFPSRALGALEAPQASRLHGAKPALISAQRHQCQTGWDVSSAQRHGGSHGVLSQREIDIISNTQLCREEGEAAKRIPSCTFIGGRGTGGLTLLWPHERRHKRRMLQVSQPTHHQVGRAGGYSRKDLILLSSIYFWLGKKSTGISLLRLIPD